MLGKRLWARIFGVESRVVLEQVEYDQAEECVVAAVRPRARERHRCGICGRPCGRYDFGEGRRRWRALDVGILRAYLEAEAPRVSCPEHGVVVARVPWARHDARHTRAFDDQVAWLTVHTSKTAVVELMRIAWRTVGSIASRVVAEARAQHDPFDGLTRIGIDEISYKKQHHYLLVVVDHDSRRLVWAAPGRDAKTLAEFFDLLGPERCAQIQLVSADAAEWIATTVQERCPNATLCLDPFHVVAWATDALDTVRREVWNAARRNGASVFARELKGARFALWKNADRLTSRQRTKLAWISKLNGPLYRAYLLKEQLRRCFELKGPGGMNLLDYWLQWARRCRIPAFVELSKKITRHRAGIEAALTHRLSNGLVESTNTKLRLLTRMAFGFKDPQALIALALLDRGGYCPPLPSRAA